MSIHKEVRDAMAEACELALLSPDIHRAMEELDHIKLDLDRLIDQLTAMIEAGDA